MAIKLIANYSKRLGLPAYSSHQFSICIETEISSVEDVAAETSRLYATLQSNVDSEIQQTGFVPMEGYGLNGHSNGNGHGDRWNCSDKQREFVLKLIDEHRIEKGRVEALSREMFGVGVKELNKLQASGLIDGLLRMVGEPLTQRRNVRPIKGGRHDRTS